ncbi:hypothetical protein SS1G_11761 [Sclerotinia sclerotiorum 1980 UF-70]|uniref:Major facilitator superfamily (MFS) profile domain-containing protein n=1 Tax=Sclerotinia sclerotiorum (strain ATCC 18683 / 1980 / Ss-1) TaxID=665079 RepID=A7F3B5_SCLS1|nr:hypothetical protein SS1G_11761 [Sclerotinia sclerotiorum 1980 UF-70]EDN97236.1 hypothetical protein SS1G_11761 [Sclerotinia sclerotiorum 1980 UF-70]
MSAEQTPLLSNDPPPSSSLLEPLESSKQNEEPSYPEYYPGNDAFMKRLVRKIDLRLMPLMFITFNFNYIDKSILSSAAVFGLVEDTHLINNQFSAISSAVEASISPAFLYAGNSFGGAVANLLSFAIGQIHSSLKPWRWLYIIFGSATAIWGFIVLIFLPDTISSAKFLTLEEKECAEGRVSKAGTGITMSIKNEWKGDQVIECLIDPKTWFCFFISLFTMIPNGGTTSYANILITSFGFTGLQSTLISLPSSLISFLTILSTGHLASSYRNTTTILLPIFLLPPIIGTCLMNWAPLSSLKLTGFYLIGFSHGTIPLTMSLIGANTKGTTKKMTVSAVMFVAYCVGNMFGPQIFRKNEETGYSMGFAIILACYCVAAGMGIVLRIYLERVNRRREMEEGAEGNRYGDIHVVDGVIEVGYIETIGNLKKHCHLGPLLA